MPVMTLRNWKMKVGYLWSCLLTTFWLYELNLSLQLHYDKYGLLTIAVAILSVFSYTYDVNIMSCFKELEVKFEDASQWRRLVASMPISVTCFDAQANSSIEYEN